MGITLKDARKKSNLTQEALCQKANVKLTTLQKLERGASNINNASVETVLKLALALNVRIEDLVTIK